MTIAKTNLSSDQRAVAIQRLTALWAFSESGLGGIMHALQIPFTGLVVGGMSVIMICFIAQLSADQYKQILTSALLVLIIKAMVSPYTPFPAYIAVSFQALCGFFLFSLFRISFASILFLSLFAMLESAIQQLLILTLFFGQSFWKATDAFVTFVAKQCGSVLAHGSQWIIGLYLLVYFGGGIIIAWMAWKTLTNFSASKFDQVISDGTFKEGIRQTAVSDNKKNTRKLWLILLLLIMLSVVLFLLSSDAKQGWLAVSKTVSWTLSVIMLWYMLINPLFIKLIKIVLQKKESYYSDAISRTLSFLPVLRQLTALAWRESKLQRRNGRWYFFLSLLIHLSLTYNESPLGSAGMGSLNQSAS